jgi:hypothetical protein
MGVTWPEPAVGTSSRLEAAFFRVGPPVTDELVRRRTNVFQGAKKGPVWSARNHYTSHWNVVFAAHDCVSGEDPFQSAEESMKRSRYGRILGSSCILTNPICSRQGRNPFVLLLSSEFSAG